MPEVPTNMQEGIAHLELEAKDVRGREERSSSMASTSDQYGYSHGRSDSRPQPSPTPGPAGYNANYEHTNASAYQNLYKSNPTQPEYRSYANAKAAESSKPSPFPKLRDAGPNVPPSDEDKEGVLERARPLVLNSNDPEMQLAWAQDALLWVETAEASRLRLIETSTTRPGTPKTEHQLRLDSLSIVNFLADQSHPKALFLKATWHEFGKFGYPTDRKEAFVGYRRAAEKGYARAEYRIGTQYEGMQDMGKAIKHYNIGVSMGDSASNYRLGMMSLLGQHGNPQDFNKGIDQIRYSAETADENAPQGAYVYGMLLARELPNINIPESVLPIDVEQARNFIEKAAYLGFAKAQLKMGSAYELCLLGCDFNPALSLHYNALAARQNEPDADMAISKWFLCGFEGIFEKNEELAFKYAQRAAQSESATAEFAMGYFYEIGMYVQTDLEQAQTWYQKAADHGNKDAVGRLNGLSQHKALSKKDHEQIAITRIKSQYGSKRGGRPERLREQRAPMPAVSEGVAEIVERVDMPSVSRQSRSGSTNAFMMVPPQPDNYPPARPKSTAPYPVDDDPHTDSFARNSQLRPMSGPQADRPMSAFGIRPLVGGPQQGYGQDLDRPATSVPDGRGSNPAGRHQVVSAGWEPQAPRSNYRQTSPGRLPPFISPPAEHGRQPSLDANVGRNRLQKTPPNTGKAQPPAPLQNGPGYPMDTPRLAPKPLVTPPSTSRYDSLPSQQPGFARGGTPNPSAYDNRASTYSQDQRHSTYSNNESVNPYTNQRPERLDSMPQQSKYTAHRPHDSGSYGSQPAARPPRSSSAAPSTQSAQSYNSSRPNSSAPSVTPSSHGQPPKKEGPKTFDEMGIPSQKNESDCVSSCCS